MPTLLIDNYDSYTYNLYQLISATHHYEPIVVRNDDWTIDEIREALERYSIQSIVISPGPGNPDNPVDTGICPEIFRSFPSVPVLGVCLGYQILASVYGGVTKRVMPVHGRLSGIIHEGHPLFDGIPRSPEALQVVRYHSLAVERHSLPPCLDPIAWTCGGSRSFRSDREEQDETKHILMALAHKQYPHYGVQFHPESVGSHYGAQLLTNFCHLTAQHHASTKSSRRCSGAVWKLGKQLEKEPNAAQTPNLNVHWQKVRSAEGDVNSDALFNALYSKDDFKDTFWLDSALKEKCRFSFMGGPGGSLWQKVVYRLNASSSGVATVVDRRGQEETWEGSIWDFLEASLQSHRPDVTQSTALPFNFCGGFVGCLGYELKALCGGSYTHQASTPDAALFFADRLVVIDHVTQDVYCVALSSMDDPSSHLEAQQWIEDTLNKIHRVLGTRCERWKTSGSGRLTEAPGFDLDRSQSRYEDDVWRCMAFLHSGDSYEICLTNKFRKARPKLSDWELYRHLRRRNPAPYAAWLKFGKGDESLTVCCSSPERFLRGDRDGTLEAKPIKGTAARSEDPSVDMDAAAALKASEKNQAENLMIVDLLRNDIGRVCQPSTVHVPSLMEVESFATVHQLVSTVQGKRRRDVSAIDAIRAAFPGGSMTGAPKIRSMEILDTLEGAPRGIYSGSIGYLSVNGTFDLNIVIRTAVLTEEEIVIGSGGAIVLQSEALEEFQEMQLKAKALLEVVSQWEQDSLNCRRPSSPHLFRCSD